MAKPEDVGERGLKPEACFLKPEKVDGVWAENSRAQTLGCRQRETRPNIQTSDYVVL